MERYWYAVKVGDMRKLQKQELIIKQQKEAYDALYYLAELMLEKHRPCRIEQIEPRSKKRTKYDVRCFRGINSTCCSSCKYLGIDGCRVKALGCKLFLCDTIRNITTYTIVALGLDSLKAFAWIINEKFVAYYTPKADVFNKDATVYVDGEAILARHG